MASKSRFILGRSKKSIAREIQNRQFREALWPNVPVTAIWSRATKDGYSTVPRTLSLITVILDHLSGKGRPVSAVYFDLWCRTNDEGVVKIQGQSEKMAQASNFTGQRAVTSWNSRIDRLAELGFILLAEGSGGKRSNALILNPHLLIRQYRGEGKIPDGLWNSLQEYALEIKAVDAVGPIEPTPDPVIASTPKKVGKKQALKAQSGSN